MSDQDRRSELPRSIELYTDRKLELAQYEWSELRRDGWLSSVPAVPSVDDVRKALALLAVISEPESEDLGEFDCEDEPSDWLN